MITVPPWPASLSALMKYCTMAFVSTVTTKPESSSTKSFVPGTVLLSQILVSPQLPLLVQVIQFNWPNEVNIVTDSMVKTTEICFVFMVSFDLTG